MDIVRLTVDQIIGLRAAALERGLSAPFTEADVLSIYAKYQENVSDFQEVETIRELNKLHRMIHELLYSPK